ncbi:unnamed protein product, partial [Musa acuminata var. zebrina]
GRSITRIIQPCTYVTKAKKTRNKYVKEKENEIQRQYHLGSQGLRNHINCHLTYKKLLTRRNIEDYEPNPIRSECTSMRNSKNKLNAAIDLTCRLDYHTFASWHVAVADLSSRTAAPSLWPQPR